MLNDLPWLNKKQNYTQNAVSSEFSSIIFISKIFWTCGWLIYTKRPMLFESITANIIDWFHQPRAKLSAVCIAITTEQLTAKAIDFLCDQVTWAVTLLMALAFSSISFYKVSLYGQLYIITEGTVQMSLVNKVLMLNLWVWGCVKFIRGYSVNICNMVKG